MAKEPGGWSLRKDPRTGVYTVRFRTKDGRRIHRSTGTKDRAEAQREAGRIYAEAHAAVRRARIAYESLEELCALWLIDHSAGRSPETIAEYERYVAVTILPHFRTLAGVTDHACAEYTRDRLRQVSASTVRKELSCLRQLCGWLYEKGYLAERIAIDPPPRRAVGSPDLKRKQAAVPLTREQVLALIDKLPEWAPRQRRGAPPIPVRAFAIVMAETGLRKGTLYRLRAPEHYHVGASHITVTNDIDKARDGRPLPLSLRARSALDSVCPDEGLIFGRIEIRWQLARASEDIGLPPHLAGRVSYHDFRRAFLTHLAEANVSAPALQYLAGHSHLSTTARYIHARQEAAASAISLLDRPALGHRSGTPEGKLMSRRSEGE